MGRSFRLFLRGILLLIVAGLFSSPAGAACSSRTGFPIYQCGDRAWFAPPPEGAGAVEALFWQLGFGNSTVSNGKGSSGAGVAPPGIFNGNDSGLARVPILSASALIRSEEVPAGALCIGPVNWSNLGVDGCCDNVRDTSKPGGDGFLNPYFIPGIFREERRIESTLEALNDYPIALLLTEETGRWFAIAAVAAASRGNDAGDIRAGHFSLGDLIDGMPNPLTGRKNIIPWQPAPAATLQVAGRPATGPDGPWPVRVAWDPVHLHSDGSRIPSEGFRIDNPGGGVGVADMGPLVRYVVESTRILPIMLESGVPDPALVLWEPLLETTEAGGEISLEVDSCVRISVLFGTKPRTRSVAVTRCALGHCGDVGYAVAGPPACLEGPVLKGAGRSRS